MAKLSDEIRAALTEYDTARKAFWMADTDDDIKYLGDVYKAAGDVLEENSLGWLRRSLAIIGAAERLHTAVSELKRIETEFNRTGIRPEWDAAYDEMFNANEALRKALEGSEDGE